MSPPRVKVKVYGLLRLSKRAYLTIQITGLLVIVLAVGMGLLLPRPVSADGRPLPSSISAVAILLDLLIPIAVLVLIVESVETVFVLRRFRLEEERQRNLREASQGHQPPESAPPGANAPGSPAHP